ncbi:MAG: hypothetical protein O2971_14780 [Proteobacteria bacterium]|nr:hypothetical protein [Pseudomonadota bacterium]
MDSKLKKILLCLVLPVLVQAVGGILIILPESGASGGPFAGILILVMFLIAAPLTLLVNGVLLLPQDKDSNFYLKRGMIMPGIFLFSCLIYYTGIWDDYIDPLFPSSTPAISPASSIRIGPNASYDFFVLTDYLASEEELQEITEWVAGESLRGTFDDQWHHRWYFVPGHLYAPSMMRSADNGQ